MNEMTYNEAIEWMDSRHWSGTGKGIVRSQELLERLGNPQDNLKFVHVAGTNGKGSVCACLSKILTAAGYQVGLFVSPHLKRFNDRIYFNGTEIGDEDFARLASRIRTQAEVMEDAPTVFEIMTAMGMLYFAEKQCDLVMLEVGMGGRLDSTNVIPAPEVAVITNIGLEHTRELGDTLAQIATEKSGILKSGCDAVLYHQSGEVEEVILAACRHQGIPLTLTNPEGLRVLESGRDGQTFTYRDRSAFHISLLGRYQLYNAATVLEVAAALVRRGWKISEEAVRQGLRAAVWPARMELARRNPDVLLDGGHNPQCMGALRRSLEELYPNRKIFFLTGVLSDKDYPSWGSSFRCPSSSSPLRRTVIVPSQPESWPSIYGRRGRRLSPAGAFRKEFRLCWIWHSQMMWSVCVGHCT